MFEQYNDADTPVSQSAFDDSELRQQMSSGANWFYWIAGLSVVNTVVNFFEGQWNFAVGLGITQILDAFSLAAMQEGAPSIVRIVLMLLGLAIAGVFFLFGVFANRAQTWAFGLGIGLYVLDGLIMLAFGDVLGILIHAFALYFLVRGFMASRQLNALPSQ